MLCLIRGVAWAEGSSPSEALQSTLEWESGRRKVPAAQPWRRKHWGNSCPSLAQGVTLRTGAWGS